MRQWGMAAKTPPPVRRSICPVACSLDLFGDRWTLLVVRDLVFGRERFKDFVASPEGIPTNILTERLTRLREAGIVEQTPAADGTKRLAYRLTEKGRSLRPILNSMRDWGLRWQKGTRAVMDPEHRAKRPRTLAPIKASA
jgi:DNA-binding HxlR family transcriptional regulator